MDQSTKSRYVVAARLSPEIYAALNAEAKKNFRSIAAQTALYIQEGLARENQKTTP